MIIQDFWIKDVHYFWVKDHNRSHCEAHRDGYTGHGATPVEALIDLHRRTKFNGSIKSVLLKYF